MTKTKSTETQLAVMTTKLDMIQVQLNEVREKLEHSYVTVDQFKPVRNIVFGMVGLILTAVIVALIGLVLL